MDSLALSRDGMQLKDRQAEVDFISNALISRWHSCHREEFTQRQRHYRPVSVSVTLTTALPDRRDRRFGEEQMVMASEMASLALSLPIRSLFLSARLSYSLFVSSKL